MHYYRDKGLAIEAADRNARRYAKEYYVAQDSRSALEYFAVATRSQYHQTRHLMPAAYVAQPAPKEGR